MCKSKPLLIKFTHFILYNTLTEKSRYQQRRFQYYIGCLGKQGARLVKQNQEILDRFLAGVRAASENAAYIEKATGDGGVRMMARDKNYNVVVDEVVTKQSLAETLSGIFKSDKNSKPFTFAVLQHTPQVFLDYCFEFEDRSFVMPSDKAYNAMHGETEKQHSLGVDGLTDALWNLYSPEYIVLQTEGNNKGHHAAIVKSKGADTLVAVELGDYRDVDRAIAGESGYYNTIITAFNDDQTYIDDLLTNQNNYILYDKSVDKKYEVPEQVASGESPSGHASETSTDIIPDSSAKGNTSDKNNLGVKQSRDERTITEEELNEYIRKEREEADERINKLLRKYQGIRKANLTKRNKSKARHSIMKKTRELNNRL